MFRHLGEFETEGTVLQLEISVQRVRVAGEHALAYLHAQASGGSDGAPSVEAAFVQLLHFDADGRIDRGSGFFDQAAAEAAFAEASGDSNVR